MDIQKETLALKKQALAAKDVISPAEAATLLKSGEFVEAGTEGSLDMSVRTPTGVRTLGYRPIRKAEAEDSLGTRLQIAKVGKAEAEAREVTEGIPTQKTILGDRRKLAQSFGRAKIPELVKQLSKIDGELKRIGIEQGIDEAELKQDVPGFGATKFHPALILTEEGQNLRQMVSGLKNVVLKMRSGGAVTPQEATRLIEEIEGAGTDRTMLQGLKNFRDTVKAAIENEYAGVSSHSRDAFVKGGGISLEQPIFGFGTPEGIARPAGDGKIESGNIDLSNRPRVQNPDGSVSTIRSMGIEEDGVQVLIPTISDDGRVLSDREAVDLYKKTGKHLGKYDSIEAANKAAKGMSAMQGIRTKTSNEMADMLFRSGSLRN